MHLGAPYSNYSSGFLKKSSLSGMERWLGSQELLLQRLWVGFLAPIWQFSTVTPVLGLQYFYPLGYQIPMWYLCVHASKHSSVWNKGYIWGRLKIFFWDTFAMQLQLSSYLSLLRAETGMLPLYSAFILTVNRLPRNQSQKSLYLCDFFPITTVPISEKWLSSAVATCILWLQCSL